MNSAVVATRAEFERFRAFNALAFDAPTPVNSAAPNCWFDNAYSVQTPLNNLRLIEISQLEPDWDGYGAQPITTSVQGNAKRLLSEMPVDMPRPEITPNGNGTISFEWQSGSGFSCLEIGIRRFSFFLKLFEAKPVLYDGLVDSLDGASVGRYVLAALYQPFGSIGLSSVVIALVRTRCADAYR